NLPLDSGAENRGERPGAAVALPRIALQRTEHDVVDPGGKGVVATDSGGRHGCVLEPGAQRRIARGWLGAGAVGRAPREQLINDAPERVDVGGGTDGFAADLLWREIAGSRGAAIGALLHRT